MKVVMLTLYKERKIMWDNWLCLLIHKLVPHPVGYICFPKMDVLSLPSFILHTVFLLSSPSAFLKLMLIFKKSYLLLMIGQV